MKLFKNILSGALSADMLMWIYPFTLIVPNVVLDITEYGNALAKITNILLPLGGYMLLISLSRKVGRTAVLCLPFAFFAGFQVVLLYLYGESIIAVDMFLNLVTTNMSEAGELLGNLAIAIVTIFLLYIVPLIWGIVLWCKGSKAKDRNISDLRRLGYMVGGAGVVMLILSYCIVPRFNISRDIFPVNVIHNMNTAVQRTSATARYYETSEGFDYKAHSMRDPHLKEIYVLIVGETSRADNWQLAGYNRPTNPRLSTIGDLLFFPKVLSESNTTHKSVPLMLSEVSAETFNDSIYSTKSIVSAFNQAGFRTAWLSNQARNRSFIDFFAREAQVVDFINDDGRHHFDHELLELLRGFIGTSPSDKMFVVMHTYGSHFNYNERYPADDRVFAPDEASEASIENRSQLLNAYDNTIVYTDALVADVIDIINAEDCIGGVLYVADHGEDIFDDSRERFLHASPVPTYYQIHVPMVLWMSEKARESFPAIFGSAAAHRNLDISSSRVVFDTMLSLGGVSTPYATPEKSIVDSNYTEGRRMYLNDYNEAVVLSESGLRQADIEKLRSKGIRLN